MRDGTGLMSHTITGKTKFGAYSFDVRFEKSGAERFMDITLSNHMNPTECAPSPSVAKPAPAPPPPTKEDCARMRKELTDDRGELVRDIQCLDEAGAEDISITRAHSDAHRA
jgi:hypothetical protein